MNNEELNVGAGLVSAQGITNQNKNNTNVGACIARPFKENQQGITLIALIITIIIMLILAGVVLNLTIGERGIFKIAQESKDQTKFTAAQEKVQLAVISSYDENGDLNDTMLKDNLNNIDGLKEKIEEIIWDVTVIVDGYTFRISKNGEVRYIATTDLLTLNIVEDEIELLKINNNAEIVGNNGKSQPELLEYTLNIEGNVDKSKLKWTSSDEECVTVDKDGKVKFVRNGSAEITCTAIGKNGETLTDTCYVLATERLYLYYYGNEFKDITGGYVESGRTGEKFSCTFNESDIYIDCAASYGGGGVFTSNSLDLTEYSYLKSYGKLISYSTGDSSGRLLAITNNHSKIYGSNWLPTGSVSYITTNMTGRKTGNETLTIDITSLTGNYYVCNAFNQSHGYIYEVWLEKTHNPTVNIIEENIELIDIVNNTPVVGNNGKSQPKLLEYTLTMEEGINKSKLNWTSSDDNIVKVDQNGKVTFVSSGEATITCTMKKSNGETLTDTCYVLATERLYLYYYGNEFKDITGDYVESGRTGEKFSSAFNESNIYINCAASYGGGGVFTSNPLDLTEYSYLKSYGQLVSYSTGDSSGRILAITNNDSKTYGSNWLPTGSVSYITTNMTGRKTGNETLTIDITSLTGNYYVCNAFNQSHGYIYEVWLEK